MIENIFKNTFFKDSFNILALFIILTTLFFYVDSSFESKNSLQFNLKEKLCHSEIVTKNGNKSFIYYLISNNGQKIRFVKKYPFFDKINIGDSYTIFQSIWLKKNIRIEVKLRNYKIDEDINILSLFLIRILFIVTFIFSVGYILATKSAFFQEWFSFVSPIGLLSNICYLFFC